MNIYKLYIIIKERRRNFGVTKVKFLKNNWLVGEKLIFFLAINIYLFFLCTHLLYIQTSKF